ncbi:uncharacterized protein BJ171DRAFT_501177 [Polychytrium aggregatum]|uniref:uncharacterized protein n=1 Tax=Polychytrium aggregatum TaxID=110093 RepID=UPI0022FE7F61|nr:uncharacterized protein BJ171DRAFT_501177 [Polychytrium aggregatum]KAI9205682.1 hypothetical protein BJ171DRAFT_501177 [Polychytrium aggregatum]
MVKKRSKGPDFHNLSDHDERDVDDETLVEERKFSKSRKSKGPLAKLQPHSGDEGSSSSDGEADTSNKKASLRRVPRAKRVAQQSSDPRFAAFEDSANDQSSNASVSDDLDADHLVDDKSGGKAQEEEYSDDDSNSEGNLLRREDADQDGNTDPVQATVLPNGKALTPAALAKFQAKVEKTGVCYLSRIPPFMKPIKVRQLLSQYGEIGRVYLVPEDPKIAARRKKYKGNRRKNYTEGWVEFMDKKVGRLVAERLNNNKIGGKKRSYYYDDIWTIKYLPRFKWQHLTEQIAYERAVRDQKLKAEMSQAKRENKVYIKNVEKAKMIEGIEARKSRKRQIEDSSSTGEVLATPAVNAASAASVEEATAAIRRRFKQRKVIDSEAQQQQQQQQQQRIPASKSKAAVLGSLFGSG